jgi:hypothetical protein
MKKKNTIVSLFLKKYTTCNNPTQIKNNSVIRGNNWKVEKGIYRVIGNYCIESAMLVYE